MAAGRHGNAGIAPGPPTAPPVPIPSEDRVRPGAPDCKSVPSGVNIICLIDKPPIGLGGSHVRAAGQSD